MLRRESQRRLSKSDRRAHPRYVVDLAMAPRVQLIDIGPGGAQLEVNCPPQIGALVPLKLHNLDGAIRNTVEYHVLKVRTLGACGRFRIHGRFPRLSPATREQVSAAARALASTSRPTTAPKDQ